MKSNSVNKKKKDNRSVESGTYGIIGSNMSFAASEAFKVLRTNLMFSIPTSEEKDYRVIGVTSSLKGEGKSTTAINLAYTVAQSGQRVVLIDADMRLPAISRRLQIRQSPGLSNLLARLCKANDSVVQSTLHENLYVIPAGDVPPNPSELLGSSYTEAVIKALSAAFDCIIFDLPPISSVADGLVISNLLDGMIVVVRQDYCDTASLAETMRQLEFLKVKILGFVLNCGDTSDNKYKYKNRYGYGYYKKPYRNDYYSEYKADKGEPMLAFDKNSSSDGDGGGGG